jgi:hypothetical protein
VRPWPRCSCGGPAAPKGPPALAISLAVDTRPERNVRNKWATIGRTQETREAITDELAVALGEGRALPSAGPFFVRLTRLSPGKPDDDGLPDALKAARDTMAAALGIDDGRAEIAFAYAGERRKGAIGLRVEVWGAEGAP